MSLLCDGFNEISQSVRCEKNRGFMWTALNLIVKRGSAPADFYCMQALIFLQFIDSEQMSMLDMGQRVSYLLYGFVFYIYN